MAAAAAALARVLRGGRRSGAGYLLPPLMPGIGRRAPLEHAAGPLLPSLGAAGDGGGICHWMLSQKPFGTELSVVENNRYMQINGPFKPLKSFEVLLDLQEKVHNIGVEASLYRERQFALYILVGVLAAMTYCVWSVSLEKEKNKIFLEELKLSCSEMESEIKKLKLAIEVKNK